MMTWAGLALRAKAVRHSGSRENALRALAQVAGVDPLKWALRGGEDYELLLTAPPDNVAELTAVVEATGVALTEIGEITAAPGVLVAFPDGRREPLGAVSWQHFG